MKNNILYHKNYKLSYYILFSDKIVVYIDFLHKTEP